MATNTQHHTHHPEDVHALLWTIFAIAAIVVLAYAAYVMYPPVGYTEPVVIENGL